MSTVIERNKVKRYGSGKKKVVLAHGFGCSQTMWKYIIPLLTDVEIITFDYVGAGSSHMASYSYEKYNSLNGYKDDILDIIHALDIEDCIFVGHSVSGMIGMLAAIEAPHLFSKLIMIGASPCYIYKDSYKGGFSKDDVTQLLDMMEMNFSGWAKYMAPFALHTTTNTADIGILEESFNANDPAIARQFAEVTFTADYREHLTSLQVPTYIIQCAEDSIVPIEVAHYLHNDIKQSELIFLEAKGHYPHISHPTPLAMLLLNIFSR